jgi:hypothetical protein
MTVDLAAIRRVFPDWPSELDIAKCEGNWASMAQNFFCAASVLQEEFVTVRERMHSREQLILSEDILKRIHLSQPAVFCISFALELAAKAATIRKIQGKGIEHEQRLPFAGHCLFNLCEQLPELNLSKDEWALIAEAEQMVVNGKYPSDIRPRDDRTIPPAPDLRHFMDRAVPIYLRLVALACDAQPGSQQDAAR